MRPGLAVCFALVLALGPAVAPDAHGQPAPIIISGLAPDAFGNFDADQCRGCDASRVFEGLCTNTCVAPCSDPARTTKADATLGCSEFDGNQSACEAAWQNGSGVALACFFTGGTCQACVAGFEEFGSCTNTCTRCADTTRPDLDGVTSPDGCRANDGNPTECAEAWVLNGFTSAPVSCFYDTNTNECRHCDVGARLGGQCAETCSVCADPAFTALANAPSDDGCLALAGDELACAATWHYSNGFVPAPCFFTAGTELNEGGFLLIQDGFDRLAPLVTNGNTFVVCLGCNGTTAVEAFEGAFAKSTLPGLGWVRENLTDPAAIAAFLDGTGKLSLALAGIVYVPSEATDAGHFGILEEQIAAMNANAAALASFVAGGGGLFALNQSRTPGGFEWLEAILPSVDVRYGASCIQDPDLTPSGEDAFPSVRAEDVDAGDDDGSAYFLGDFGSLAVLATQSCHDVSCKDPAHTTFAGGPGDDVCPAIPDQPTCDASWYVTQSGIPAPCSFQNGGAVAAGGPRGALSSCIGCGRNQQGEDPCPNTCPGCDDPARTLRLDFCESVGANVDDCAVGWEPNGIGINSSCFFDGEAGFCRTCSPENERLGLCTNSCEPPAAERAVVIGLGVVATPEPTSTPTPEPTSTPTATPEPESTATSTPEEATPIPTPTPTETRSPEPTVTPTATPIPTSTTTATTTPDPTATATPVVAGALRSFQCYAVHQGPFSEIPGVVLSDELGTGTTDLQRTKRLCAPADVGAADPGAPADARHLLGYDLDRRTPRFAPRRHVVVSNDLGGIDVDVLRPVLLMSPTGKSLAADPGPPGTDLDHFQCYHVEGARQRANDLGVVDQFGSLTLDVKRPLRLCLPVNKNDEGIADGSRALMCYRVRAERPPQFPGRNPVFVHDQFGPRRVRMKRPTELCLPSTVILSTSPD